MYSAYIGHFGGKSLIEYTHMTANHLEYGVIGLCLKTQGLIPHNVTGIFTIKNIKSCLTILNHMYTFRYKIAVSIESHAIDCLNFDGCMDGQANADGRMVEQTNYPRCLHKCNVPSNHL